MNERGTITTLNNTVTGGRRNLLRWIASGLLFVIFGSMFSRRNNQETVWQLDPEKCIQCGLCASTCVMNPSAVKCVHAYSRCGYCDLCSGYFVQNQAALDTGAENQLCPASAIKRTFIEDPFFLYTIDEKLCVGCGRCVKGCAAFGNGSLFLQIRHDRCKNCNQCAIATACPAGAFRRVTVNKPYLMKSGFEDGGKT